MEDRAFARRFRRGYRLMSAMLAVTGMAMLMGGCGSSPLEQVENLFTDPDPVATPATAQEVVTVSMPDTAPLDTSTLKVNTFYGAHDISANETTLKVSETATPQIVTVEDTAANALFLAYIDSATSTVIDATSVAKGIIWLNPYVMTIPSSKKAAFLTEATASSLFGQLVTKVETVLKTDPANLLDPTAHPEIAKTSFAVVKGTFESLASSNAAADREAAFHALADVGRSNKVKVKDGADKAVELENPYSSGYGVEIENTATGEKQRKMVKRKDETDAFTWAWPPSSNAAFNREATDMEDGRYNVNFCKGLETASNNWQFPWIPDEDRQHQYSPNATIHGTAAWYNVLLVVNIFIESVTGESIEDDISATIIPRAAKRASKMTAFEDVLDTVEGGDPIALITEAVRMMETDWAVLSDIIWGADAPDSESFLKAARALLKNMEQVFKTVPWSNEAIPRVYDLVFSPACVSYCVESNAQELSECAGASAAIPPDAALDITPSVIYVGDEVTLNAAASSDDQTDALSLQFRFDHDGDGTYDADWSTTNTVVATYQTAGKYTVAVEVKDEDGLVGITTEYITVYGTDQGISAQLVIDRSGSMSGAPIVAAKDAAKTFVGFFGTQDRGAVMSFNSSTTTDQAFTGDTSLLTAAIDSISSGGGTAAYDAAYEGITAAANEAVTRRRATVLLSDGQDGSSTHSVQEVVDYSVQEGVPLYVIGLGNGVNTTTLTTLAVDSGGLYFESPTTAELERVYLTILGIL